MFTRSGLFACSLFLASTAVLAADNTASVIEPVIKREPLELAIHSRDFEVGVIGGLISADDYNVALGAGVKLGYHFYNNWFAEASLFRSASINNNDSQGEITIADLVMGYNLYQDTYLSSNFRAKSSVYVLGGGGLTQFNEGSFKTLVGGGGYRIMLSDNVSARAEVRGNLHRAFSGGGWSLDTQATLGLGYYF